MQICERLLTEMRPKAAVQTVAKVSIGLGYTAVSTSAGGAGLAFTAFESKHACRVLDDVPDYEGRPAMELLEAITSPRPVHRSMALALINALNHPEARALPEDRSNRVLFELLGIVPGTHLAMGGYFAPLVTRLERQGVELEIFDIGRRMGDLGQFTDRLAGWAQALILTSTSLLNDTAESLLAAVDPQVKVAMIGPSTPLVAAAFEGLPVHVLGGTVPLDVDGTFKAIRHGRGTPVLQKLARKVYRVL